MSYKKNHMLKYARACLWLPYEIGQAIIFLPWFLASIFFCSINLSGRRLDVYHTSIHGVALVQI